MTDPYAHPDVAALIAAALAEDLRGQDDVTCAALVPATARLNGELRAKAGGVVCGLPLFVQVIAALGGGVEVIGPLADGTAVKVGDVALRLRGNAAVMLKAERIALNLCQRLSGTATMTRRFVAAVAGTRAAILDTRKTTPGLRVLEKHAVVAGGGRNHRMGLYDQVLIKDNHIALMPPGAYGSGPAEAVRRCRERLDERIVVEVEIEHLRDLLPVVSAGADIVLLDNMAPDLLRQAVALRDGNLGLSRRQVLLEASGGITLDNVRAFAESGVDRISTGAITHSVHALDLSLRCAPL